MVRITPFMLATKVSRSPKSVNNVMSPRGFGTLQFLETDLHHLVLDCLDRSLYLDEIPDSFSNERLANRRLNRDAVQFHIRFILSHQRVFTLRLRLLFNQMHGSAEHDGFGYSSSSFDNAGVGQLRLQFYNARLDESLSFFGSIVLRILTQIAMGAGLGNGLDRKSVV